MDKNYVKSELQGYGVQDDMADSAVDLVENVHKASGWHIDKCIAFAARKCGAYDGDIGPDWKKPGKK